MARFSLSATDLKQPEVVELVIKAFKQLHKAKFLAINSDVVRFLSGLKVNVEIGVAASCKIRWIDCL